MSDVPAFMSLIEVFWVASRLDPAGVGFIVSKSLRAAVALDLP